MTVTLTILYPDGADVRFDEDYYVSTHIPLARKVWGDAVVGTSVVFGLEQRGGGEASYRCLSQVDFASKEAFNEAMSRPGNADVGADVANFCNVRPTVLVGRKA